MLKNDVEYHFTEITESSRRNFRNDRYGTMQRITKAQITFWVPKLICDFAVLYGKPGVFFSRLGL